MWFADTSARSRSAILVRGKESQRAAAARKRQHIMSQKSACQQENRSRSAFPVVAVSAELELNVANGAPRNQAAVYREAHRLPAWGGFFGGGRFRIWKFLPQLGTCK